MRFRFNRFSFNPVVARNDRFARQRGLFWLMMLYSVPARSDSVCGADTPIRVHAAKSLAATDRSVRATRSYLNIS